MPYHLILLKQLVVSKLSGWIFIGSNANIMISNLSSNFILKRHLLPHPLVVLSEFSKKYFGTKVPDYRRFSQKNIYKFPKFTPREVSLILRENEFCRTFDDGPVKYYDTNKLSSNSPIEDRNVEVQSTLTGSKLFGVFDGHGGHHCANFVRAMLPYYIVLSLLPLNVLAQYLTSHEDELSILEHLCNVPEMTDQYREFQKARLRNFSYHLLTSRTRDTEFSVKNMFESAFYALDTDISQNALHGDEGKPLTEMLEVALSGSCACLAHIDGVHLQLANVGDCRAVLGSLTNNNEWKATTLTHDHNTDNLVELQRVMNSHPRSEANTVVKNNRLLGQLIPLRAFGDFMYKWSSDVLKKVLVPVLGAQVLPPNYRSPPYLISEPEVTHLKLTPKDRFLVIASDGLWDTMSPEQTVKFVGEYMSGKQTLEPVKLPNSKVRLKEINSMLAQRREGLSQKPVDDNAATHLMRTALGGTEYGVDHGKLSTMLSIPPEFVRSVRDDITITVIFFENEYFRNIKL